MYRYKQSLTEEAAADKLRAFHAGDFAKQVGLDCRGDVCREACSRPANLESDGLSPNAGGADSEGWIHASEKVDGELQRNCMLGGGRHMAGLPRHCS